MARKINLVITSEAKVDLEETITWYENAKSGLGGRFLRTFQVTSIQLEQNPKSGPIIRPSDELRRLLVPKFPYVILYKVIDQTVVIVAIFHGSTDLRNRLTKR